MAILNFPNSMNSENYDQGVQRSWDRKSKNVIDVTEIRRFAWVKLRGDELLRRQVTMMREGRYTLHNCIRNAHGLPNRY